MPKNANCSVSDSELCKWMDKDCKDCYINSFKHGDEAKKVLSDFQVTLSLLPENFDVLLGDECCFCKEEKKPRDRYAVIDFAHSDPESTRGMFFGIGKKVRQRVGSLMPISIAICKDCRNRLRMSEYIKWLSIAALVAVAIGLCFIPALNAHPVMPYGVVILGFLAGYILGKVLSNAYVNAKSASTAFNVFEIPVCAEMKNRGWFLMQDSGPVSRYIFSKKAFTKKLSSLYEATPEELSPEAPTED